MVSDLIKGSCQNTKKIYVLLVNMQLLTGAKMLTRDDYDYGVEGFYRPLDAIRATRPVVIIDEPHRFSRDQRAFGVIANDIKPQSIIRFGATFPETTTGHGSNRITIKDYQNLLYDLNACASFSQNLMKGVAKEHFEPVSRREEKVKITSIRGKDAVVFQYKKRDETTRSFTLQTGDSLSIISDAFEGITVSAIATLKVEFSNGVIKTTGEKLDVDIYMTSYQEQMIRLALERHFETEKENFCNRTFKIKTLALFFIDDISSYRPDGEGKPPYLRLAFECLVKERMETVLASLDEHDAEYRAYLKASLADIFGCHAGYFSQDNSDSDEDIAKEYDAYAYDSPLEQKNIMTDVEEVIVYGKIPRNSISIPTITGGMYSPDFMFVVKRASGAKELHIVVETKDVENKSELRGNEKAKIACAQIFFEMLSQDGYTVYFRDQLNNKQTAQIINEILAQ